MKLKFNPWILRACFSSVQSLSASQIAKTYQRHGKVEKQVSDRILRATSFGKLFYMYSQLVRNIDYNPVHVVLLFGRLVEHEAARADKLASKTVSPLDQNPIFFKLLNSLEKCVYYLRPDFISYLLNKTISAAKLGINVSEVVDAVVDSLATESNFNLLSEQQLIDIFGDLTQLFRIFPRCMGLDSLLSNMQLKIAENAISRCYESSQLLTFAKWLNFVPEVDRKVVNRLNKQITSQGFSSTRGLYSWYFLNRRISTNDSALARVMGSILDLHAYQEWNVSQCARFLSAMDTEVTHADTLIKSLRKNCLARLKVALQSQIKGESPVEGLHLVASYLKTTQCDLSLLYPTLRNLITKKVPQKAEEYSLLVYLLKKKFGVDQKDIIQVISNRCTSYVNLCDLLDLNDALNSWSDEALESLHRKIIKVFVKRSSTSSESFDFALQRMLKLPWTQSLRLWLVETVRKALSKLCLITSHASKKDSEDLPEDTSQTFLQLAQVIHLLSEVIPDNEDLGCLPQLFKTRMLTSGINDTAAEVLMMAAQTSHKILAETAKCILTESSRIKLA